MDNQEKLEEKYSDPEPNPEVSRSARKTRQDCPEFLLGRVGSNRRRFRYPCLLEADHEPPHIMHCLVGANRD